VELGTSVGLGLGNSALGLSDVLTRVVVIDLDELYEATPKDGLRLGAAAAAETHLVAHFGRLGLGVYADAYDLSRSVIPREFIGLLTQGNALDQTYTGSADILQRSFAQTGAFASFDIHGFVVAGKFSVFAPLLYSDSTTKATFLLETAADGTVRGEIAASGNVYTSVGEAGLQGCGFNVSLGVVRRDEQGKPWYGGALNNIPVMPARPGYLLAIEQFRYEFEAVALLESLNQELDPFSTESEIGDVEMTLLDPAQRPRVHMPFSMSGFYRFAIPVIDIIPSAELVLQAPVHVNAGLAIAGNVFPANLLSLGFGWRDFLWQASLGLRVPLRVFELEVRVATVGADFSGLFDGSGLGGRIALALGY
jgi:hypothetical protein